VSERDTRFVELCPFRVREEGGEFLLLRRSATETVYPGLWQFVTGRVEEGERAAAAALRELREETGIAPERFWVVPAVNAFYDPAADAIRSVAVFAARLPRTGDVLLSAEHDAYEWLSAPEARRTLVWPAQRHCLDIVEQYILGGEEAGRLLALPL